MASLLQDLVHRKVSIRPSAPLSKEASAAGIGVAIGILLMAIFCLAMKMT